MSELLSLEGKIDLVIPRGSGDLIRSIQQQAGGKMPVLGHSEGICTVYVDAQADLRKALKIGKHINTHTQLRTCASTFHLRMVMYI